jgi:hypothetical protein
VFEKMVIGHRNIKILMLGQNAEFYADFESVEKVARMLSRKVRGQRTLRHSTKRW